MSKQMRAKMKVGSVMPVFDSNKEKVSEIVNFHAVAATKYDSTGVDEDNTFAKFSPSASVQIMIANPALLNTFEPGQTFYVDFTPVAG